MSQRRTVIKTIALRFKSAHKGAILEELCATTG